MHNKNPKYAIVPWDSSRNEEARIVKNLAFQDHWGSTPNSSELWLQLVNGSTARLDHSFFAVNQQQEIVGLLLTHRYESDDDLLGKRIGWIDKLATLAEYRKQSIAKNLSFLIVLEQNDFAFRICREILIFRILLILL
jgi:hypothetical protein